MRQALIAFRLQVSRVCDFIQRRHRRALLAPLTHRLAVSIARIATVGERTRRLIRWFNFVRRLTCGVRPRQASTHLLTEILTNKRGISAKWTPRLLGHSPVCHESGGWKVQGARLVTDITASLNFRPPLVDASRSPKNTSRSWKEKISLLHFFLFFETCFRILICMRNLNFDNR